MNTVKLSPADFKVATKEFYAYGYDPYRNWEINEWSYVHAHKYAQGQNISAPSPVQMQFQLASMG